MKEARSTFRSEIVKGLVCVHVPAGHVAHALVRHFVVREEASWGLCAVEVGSVRGAVSYFGRRRGVSGVSAVGSCRSREIRKGCWQSRRYRTPTLGLPAMPRLCTVNESNTCSASGICGVHHYESGFSLETPRAYSNPLSFGLVHHSPLASRHLVWVFASGVPSEGRRAVVFGCLDELRT